MIDETFNGLVAPRRTFAIGRPEIEPADRPGAILMSLVGEFRRNGDAAPQAAEPGDERTYRPPVQTFDSKVARWFDDADEIDLDRAN